MTASAQFYGNPRFLHLWDNEEAKTFGLPSTVSLNDAKLSGFLSILAKLNVAMVRLPSASPLRTVWDSLTVRTIDSAYHVDTTYPLSEYDLNRDVFLAIGFRNSLANYDLAIEAYHPRVQLLPKIITTAIVKDVTAQTTSVSTGKRKTMTTGEIIVDRKQVAPMNHFQNITPTGVKFTDPASTPPNPEIYIFGSGGADPNHAMGIKTVARGVNDFEVDGFYTHLFRFGM
jgi:hypothetical protein